MSPTPSGEFTTFSISRRVVDGPGARRFLAKVHEIGRIVMPGDRALLPASILSEADRHDLEYAKDDDEFGPPILSHLLVGSTRLRLYQRLEMPILERTVPNDMNYLGRFNWASNRMRANKQRVIHPKRTNEEGEVIPTRTHMIHQELERSLLEFDGYDLENTPVGFTGITWVNNRARGYDELALQPDPAEPAVMLWMRQADICFNALERLSKKAAYPDQPMSPAVTFARVPKNASVEDRAYLVRSLQDNALPVSLQLGSIKMDVTNRSSLGS